MPALPGALHSAEEATPHPREDIYVMNANGSELKRLTTNPAADFDSSWSPDGTKIVFRREPQGALPDIFVMQPDGSAQTQLTRAGGERPVWSPDGQFILFSGNGLYVMNADGSAITPLPTPGVKPSVLVDWTR
jgi:TolB protein